MSVEQSESLLKMKSTTRFLSDITGLPITKSSLFPEIPDIIERKSEQTNYRYSLKLTLGNKGNSSDEYRCVTTWDVSYNDLLLFEDYPTDSGRVNKQIFFDQKQLSQLLGKKISHIVGGPNSEVAFMDYGTYTLESLKREYNYFRNIYLILMTNMKERGLPMPPILSKNNQIREAMEHGDIDSIKKMLTTIQLLGSGDYDLRCQAHMRKEAEVITESTKYEYNKRNPLLPIELSFPGIEVEVVKGNEKESFRPANILVVENNLNTLGFFIDEIKKRLEADGRYNGTKLILEFNLGDCMNYCESGKINMILFDWQVPSHEEILELRGDNPVFKAFHGNEQANLTFGANGYEADISTGMHLDEQRMKEESERIDIRSQWMKMISNSCKRAGVTPPEHFIVRTERQLHDIAQILSLPLGKRT